MSYLVLVDEVPVGSSFLTANEYKVIDLNVTWLLFGGWLVSDFIVRNAYFLQWHWWHWKFEASCSRNFKVWHLNLFGWWGWIGFCCWFAFAIYILTHLNLVINSILLLKLVTLDQSTFFDITISGPYSIILIFPNIQNSAQKLRNKTVFSPF